VLSIKARQVAAVTSLVGVVVVAVSVLHLGELARVALEETKSRGDLLANAIYQRAREVVPDAPDPYSALREDKGLRSILESAAAYSENVTYAAIVDADGTAVAHSFPRLQGQPLVHAEDLTAVVEAGAVAQLRAVYSDSTYEIRKPLLTGTEGMPSETFGAIRIGVSPLLVRNELKEGLSNALKTAAIALLVALLVSMLLAQWFLRPIHVIKSGLSRLGKGELDVRLDLPPGDEFRELGTSFDALTKRLAAEPAPPEYSQRLIALGRLLTGLAHEVKNPLNAMMIHLELLRTKLGRIPQTARRPAPALAGTAGPATPLPLASDPESEVMKHAGVIADEIRRLDLVLQGFLKFARPGEMKREPVAIESLVQEVARVVDPQAGGARVDLRVDIPPNLPQIQGDATMLGQALMNLTLNAVQAMPDGGTLRLSARNGGRGRVEVAVEDTGIGIAPENLGRIFELYFTTRNQGSGIGLSMVYRIVQLHDGDIEVESIPGRGTKFRLMLPALKEKDDEKVAGSEGLRAT
jgi:signal transduction histidine kinase